MSFANTYFSKYDYFPLRFSENPAENTEIITVIPAFNETEISKPLNSLFNSKFSGFSVEIILVINSSEKSKHEIIKNNIETFNSAKKFAEKNNSENFKIHVFNIENLPEKTAGVGLARKIGMDAALARFNKLCKARGIITGFDADSVNSENYFEEIYNFFKNNPKINAASIYFEHPLEGNDFEEDIYQKIINYELHLRYFINSLRKINFPFAFQTIGSSFAVTAKSYALQGGMNKKKAGEDFYFLQKLIQTQNYADINQTCVFPSPRLSDRVPFGTGAALAKMKEQNTNLFYTYNPQSFVLLEKLFAEKNIFYKSNTNFKINPIIDKFLEISDFYNELKKINQNSPNSKIFTKRFFDWFNAFRVIKFLNFAHENYLEKILPEIAVKQFLTENNIRHNNCPNKELLYILRQNDKKSNYKINL